MENNKHIHSFKKAVVPSNCQERGYTLYRCECGYEHKDNFTPLGNHDFKVINEVKPTCTKSGEQGLVCSVCGKTRTAVTDPTGHTWGEWVVQEFATCTENGKKVRFCKACNADEEQIIPAKGHNLSPMQKSKTEKGVMVCYCKNCGETIKKPTGGSKFTSFLKKYKVALIAVPLILLAISILAPTAKFFIIPQTNYTLAKKAINEGNYIEAYQKLKSIYGYRDSEDLLRGFTFQFSEKSETETKYDDYSETKTTYKYNKDGFLTEIIEYDSLDNLENKKVYEYNENGKTLSISEITGSGKLTSKSTYTYDSNNLLIHEKNTGDSTYSNYEYTYEYDDKGNKVLENYYDEDGELSSAYKYEYDDEGNIIKKAEYDDEGELRRTYEYTYDDNGNKTELKYYTGYGYGQYDGDYKIIYEYDKNGYLIKETKYVAESYGDKCEYEHIFKYDKNGNITYSENDGSYFFACLENLNISEDQKLSIKYKYDKKGNLTEEVWSAGKDKIYRYKYQYDTDNNLISKKEYDSENELTKAISYEYGDCIVSYIPATK